MRPVVALGNVRSARDEFRRGEKRLQTMARVANAAGTEASIASIVSSGNYREGQESGRHETLDSESWHEANALVP